MHKPAFSFVSIATHCKLFRLFHRAAAFGWSFGSQFSTQLWSNSNEKIIIHSFVCTVFIIMDEIVNASVINHSTVVFGRFDAVGFVDVENGLVKFHHVIDEKVCGNGISGVSCISGHENELIYAIGDVSTPPRIILYAFPNTSMGQLQSKFIQMIISMAWGWNNWIQKNWISVKSSTIVQFWRERNWKNLDWCIVMKLN